MQIINRLSQESRPSIPKSHEAGMKVRTKLIRDHVIHAMIGSKIPGSPLMEIYSGFDIRRLLSFLRTIGIAELTAAFEARD
jgi:hypothetical protein